MRLERWNHEEREHREQFRGRSFLAIDPGREGYALGYSGNGSAAGYCHALEPISMWDLARLVGASVFILEAQHIRQINNANSILDLGFRAGMTLGWVAALMPHPMNLFQVAPSTWQSHQRKKLGRPKAQKGEALLWTLERGEQVFGRETEWQLANRKQREGMASALGIAEWWISLW